MQRKREPVKHPCTLGDHNDDDMGEEVEDPTLSGGLRRNSDDDQDRQSLRTDDDEEGDQVECGQGQQQQEEENDEDSSDTKVGADYVLLTEKNCHNSQKSIARIQYRSGRKITDLERACPWFFVSSCVQ